MAYASDQKIAMASESKALLPTPSLYNAGKRIHGSVTNERTTEGEGGTQVRQVQTMVYPPYRAMRYGAAAAAAMEKCKSLR